MTYKYRLLPTQGQRRTLNQTLEQCRWVYNQSLALRKTAWEQERRSISYYESKRLLPIWKNQRPELTSVHSQVLQNVTQRVEWAFQAFFRRVKAGENPGYPRFKGPGGYDSFTYPQYGYRVEIEKARLQLSKIGNVRANFHRPIEGTIKTVTLQRDRIGNWYACLACEVEVQPRLPNENKVGIDLGLKTFATLSDGSTIERQRWIKRDEKDIARLQRKKERFPKGSPQRRQILHTLHHAYQRAAHRRTNFAHQTSRQLVNTYQVMFFEDLDIQELQGRGNKVVNRGIADVAWGQFVQFTTYKAERAGRVVLRVNPRGTTQECSGCGQAVPKDLSVRVHNCPYCGLKLDRDLNAARNILARGLASVGSDP